MDTYDLLDMRNDCARLYGNFGFRVFDKGRQILRVQKKNQITNSGRLTVLNLLCPFTYTADQSQFRLWSLSVGINATPPTLTDDEVTMNPVWTSAFDFPGGECAVVDTPPNDFRIQITKVLPTSSTADGETITEAGIFTRGDDDDPGVANDRLLYARQVHSPIEKTSTMSIEYDWQLGIVVQTTS